MRLVEFRLEKMYEAGFSKAELDAAEHMADELIAQIRLSLSWRDWLRLMPWRPRLGIRHVLRRRPG